MKTMRLSTMRRLPDDSGLTIIEVMIVLAIAAVILMIVFEAVPSLQRGSRNGLRKQDIQTILEAVSKYELNDSGKFPDDCGGGGHSACADTGGSTPNDYFLRFIKGKLAFYNDYNDNNQIVLRNQSPGSAAVKGPETDVDKVELYNYALCDKSGATTYFGAGYSDVAAIYAIETGNGGHASECQQL